MLSGIEHMAAGNLKILKPHTRPLDGDGSPPLANDEQGCGQLRLVFSQSTRPPPQR